jgi:hypothetical protein
VRVHAQKYFKRPQTMRAEITGRGLREEAYTGFPLKPTPQG